MELKYDTINGPRIHEKISHRTYGKNYDCYSAKQKPYEATPKSSVL